MAVDVVPSRRQSEGAGLERNGGTERPDVASRLRTLGGELRIEADEWDRDGGLPRSVFERLGAAGAFEARWPHRTRAGGGDIGMAALIIREAALASVGGCIAVGTHMEGYFRALARSEYGAEVWDDALHGRRVGAMSVTEATAGSTPTTCGTRAQPSAGGWTLTGHKHYVSNMRAAHDCAVFTRTDDGRDLSSFTIFIVPLDAPGVRVTPHRLVGCRASGTAMLDLQEMQIGDERRVGRVGSGLMLLLEFLRAERIMAACAGLAVAELCLEMALAFTERRESAGLALRQHQAIAHRLAELASDIAAGRALVRERLAAAQRGQITSAEAGQAKLVLNRIAWRVADEAVQMLGGRGLTEETAMARIWRDIRIGRIGGGTDEVQLELVSQSLRTGELSDHPAVRDVKAIATDGAMA
jgi:acyl-CoA dehydrogenase